VNQSDSAGVQWIIKNQSVLRWKLIGPNIGNPFDSAASDDRLEEYVNDKSILMEACQVNALMDDTIVIKITDLTIMKFQTDHPNLQNLSQTDLEAAMKQAGVWSTIDAEFKKLQDACARELDQRKGGGGF